MGGEKSPPTKRRGAVLRLLANFVPEFDFLKSCSIIVTDGYKTGIIS